MSNPEVDVPKLSSEADESSTQDIGETVRIWWSAVESGDLKTIADMLTDDMVWEVMQLGYLMPHGGVFRGKKEVEEDLIAIMPTAFYTPGQTKMEIIDMHIAGNVVILETRIDATTASGRRMEDARYVQVITVENGKIKYAREYPDALKAKAAHLD